jgi:hypothetical protein
MPSSAELIDKLRKFQDLWQETTIPLGGSSAVSDLFGQAADALERCEASLATCETRREALEAENTFLREEISAAAQRQKALAPRENESGEGQ